MQARARDRHDVVLHERVLAAHIAAGVCLGATLNIILRRKFLLVKCELFGILAKSRGALERIQTLVNNLFFLEVASLLGLADT